MIISLIAAVSKNGAIGNKGRLPWGKLKADLRRFKELTLGHMVVMGRKTFESIGEQLEGRKNIVVTRQKNYGEWTYDGVEFDEDDEGMVLKLMHLNNEYVAEGCVQTESPEEAMCLAYDSGETEVFIIGGGEIFYEMIYKADKLYITHIDADFSGDAFFPKINERIWQRVGLEEWLTDLKFGYRFSFVTYERILRK